MALYCLSVSSSILAPNAYPKCNVDSLHDGPAKAAAAFVSQMKARYPEAIVSTLQDPTAECVIAALTKKRPLAAGDVFVFQYVGHGAVARAPFPGMARLPPEARGENYDADAFVQSTLVLHDRMLLQCEFQKCVVALGSDITFFNIIDACNAGAFILEDKLAAKLSTKVSMPTRATVFDRRPILSDLYDCLYAASQKAYDQLNVAPPILECRGIHFAAVSASSSTSAELFTKSIAQTLAQNDHLTYSSLSQKVAKLTNDWNLPPVLIAIGKADATDLDRPIFT